MRAKHLSLGICFALFATATSLAQAQFSFGTPGPKSEVLMQPEVQKDLKVSREQMKQIQAAMQSMSQANMANMPNMNNMGDASAMVSSMDAQILAPLSPDQTVRLNELWLQYEGPRVLRDKTVSDQVKLTPDQVSKIGDIWEAYSKVAMEQMMHMRSQSQMNV
jgi:hypothetical protein